MVSNASCSVLGHDVRIAEQSTMGVCSCCQRRSWEAKVDHQGPSRQRRWSGVSRQRELWGVRVRGRLGRPERPSRWVSPNHPSVVVANVNCRTRRNRGCQAYPGGQCSRRSVHVSGSPSVKHRHVMCPSRHIQLGGLVDPP